MENSNEIVNLLNEENLVIKELDGRIYFEAIPLITAPLEAWKDKFETSHPSAVTGVRG